MKLVAGERYCLPEENSFVEITAGKVEVYAVTHQKENFRQMYLMELNAGEAAFPSFDDFENIKIEVHALTDSELKTVSVNEIAPSELAQLIRSWFKNLIALPFLRLLADKGDDTLATWLDGSLIGDSQDNQSLWEIFIDNQSIFSMMLGVRFQAEDVKFTRRIARRLKQKNRLVENTLSILLGKDTVPAEEGSSGNAKFEEVAFVIRCALQALHMPSRSANLAPEMIRKLDKFGIMYRLAQKVGIGLRRITLEQNWYCGDSGIILIFYNIDDKTKELGICLPQTENRYRLITSSNPDGIEVTEKVATALDKEGFACYAGLPSEKISLKDLFKFAFNQTWSTDWRTIFIASFVMGIIPIITPIVTETIFADLIPILDRQGLATVAQVAMVAGFTSAALNIVRSVALLRFSVHVDMALESAMLARVLALPIKFFRQFTSGNLAARMQGLSRIQTFLQGEMVGTVFNFVFGFWSLGLMCYYSVKLTGAAVLVWIIYSLISFFILNRLTNFNRKQIKAYNETAGILQQIFTGLTKFRVKGAEEDAYNLWGKKFGEEWKWNYAVRWQKNYTTILSAMQPILLSMFLYYFAFKEIVEAATTAASGASAATDLMETGLTYATFIAFQAAYSAFNVALIGIFPAIQEFVAIRPLLENLQPILNAEPESSSDKPEADVLSGAIEVEGLTFAYGENLPDVLKNVSFRIKAGESVALVGSSGCGKTTLMRLLLGFEQPKSGAIYYDGYDLSELSAASVRAQMGVVLQGGQLMTGNIFYNIVGMSNLTLDDAWEAAEAAGIAEDIRQMPMGMQTVISEGSNNISGGQRQRILIARALAAKPAIIILDEATSALDNRTQAIVTESLDRINATRIIVAHRLSTIRNVDKIFVLDGGRIVESGTFDELVAKGGMFAGFVKRQVV
ncbi:MAG: NHLP bacteriocin export ABC transporter permease/ATPase subunit [Selenomonadaceae bacterium]|nr:NHLP bacteriocin export ABC transporter permease/ATPase subunit [Selenomonadaceae bacterium]